MVSATTGIRAEDVPEGHAPDVSRPSLRRAALVAWALVLAVWSLTRGLPVDRTSQTLFWLGLLVAANVGTTWTVRAGCCSTDSRS